MVHGVQPPSFPTSKGPADDPNLQQLKEWETDAYNATQSKDACMLFSNVYNDLKSYVDNYPKGFKSLQDVKDELQKNFFSGSGNQDVYANSGLGDAEPVQSLMGQLGLTPPPVTDMDKLFMQFQQGMQSGTLPKNDPFLRVVREELFSFGSQDSTAAFKTWAQNQLNTNQFKNEPQSVQNFFKQLLASR